MVTVAIWILKCLEMPGFQIQKMTVTHSLTHQSPRVGTELDQVAKEKAILSPDLGASSTLPTLQTPSWKVKALQLLLFPMSPPLSCPVKHLLAQSTGFLSPVFKRFVVR